MTYFCIAMAVLLLTCLVVGLFLIKMLAINFVSYRILLTLTIIILAHILNNFIALILIASASDLSIFFSLPSALP